MKKVNIILHGKGGCGKTSLAILLYSLLKKLEKSVVGIDIDFMNPSFSVMSKKDDFFNVISITDYVSNANYDINKINNIFNTVLQDNEHSHFIIDSGSSNIEFFSSYLIDNKILDMLSSQMDIYIHTIVHGDAGNYTASLSGAASIRDNFPENNVILWLNDFGNIGFFETKAYKENPFYAQYIPKFNDVIQLPSFGNDKLEKLQKEAREKSIGLDKYASEKNDFMLNLFVKTYFDKGINLIKDKDFAK